MAHISVFMDEGALDGESRAPSACGVVVNSPKSVSDEIGELIHKLTLQADFQLEPNAASFKSTGFHYVDDNLNARLRFIDLLRSLDFEWYCSSRISADADDPYMHLPRQFAWLASRIMQKYKTHEIHFVFEQNSRLNQQYGQIVEQATRDSGIDNARVTHEIGTKKDRILSVADYCIAIASQAIKLWVGACCDLSILAGKHQYRNFASIEPMCSTLFSADYQKSLSSRQIRLMDHTFHDVTGAHSSTCRQATKP